MSGVKIRTHTWCQLAERRSDEQDWLCLRVRRKCEPDSEISLTAVLPNVPWGSIRLLPRSVPNVVGETVPWTSKEGNRVNDGKFDRQTKSAVQRVRNPLDLHFRLGCLLSAIFSRPNITY